MFDPLTNFVSKSPCGGGVHHLGIVNVFSSSGATAWHENPSPLPPRSDALMTLRDMIVGGISSDIHSMTSMTLLPIIFAQVVPRITSARHKHRLLRSVPREQGFHIIHDDLAE